jgi:hypothetical protein
MQTTFSDLNQRYPPGRVVAGNRRNLPSSDRTSLLQSAPSSSSVFISSSSYPPVFTIREEKKRKDLMCAAATYHAHPCNKSCVGTTCVWEALNDPNDHGPSSIPNSCHREITVNQKSHVVDVLRPAATPLWQFGCRMRQSRRWTTWPGRSDSRHDRRRYVT